MLKPNLMSASSCFTEKTRLILINPETMTTKPYSGRESTARCINVCRLTTKTVHA